MGPITIEPIELEVKKPGINKNLVFTVPMLILLMVFYKLKSHSH